MTYAPILLESGTLSKVKAKLERQNIKFISKYTSTQTLRTFSLDQFKKFRQEYHDFISRYGFCLIEAYGNADNLRKLGVFFYVKSKPIQSTPVNEKIKNAIIDCNYSKNYRSIKILKEEREGSVKLSV